VKRKRNSTDKTVIMKKLLPLFALATLPLFSGCAVLAGAAVGTVVVNEMVENKVYEAQFNMDAEEVWHSAKATASHASSDPIEVDTDLRKLKAKIDGATVTISVETFDLDQSILRVEARKYGVINGEIAKNMLTKIREGLEGDV
jgi:hypothetical protein